MKSGKSEKVNHNNRSKQIRKENMMKTLVKTLLVLCVALAGVVSAQTAIETSQLQAVGITYYDVNSDIARQHTQDLRDDQAGLNIATDFGEEIVFVTNAGINVQFADGSGRRVIIARGSGYSQFWYPAWSLDGTKIAFAATTNDPRVVDLVVANSDGSNPTVILELDAGYYNSYIQSISWHWASEYIMFTYAYNDIDLNSLFVICTIHYSGSNFVVGPGPDRSYCQYEPRNNSQRYAYIAAGRPFYMNSDLRVSNLDGSNDQLWFQYTGAIAGFTHVVWKNQNSLYTIIRNWDQYPNREVLLRIDRINNQTYYTTLIFSEPNASLWTPTLSPNRLQMYMSELIGNNGTMWLTTFNSNGDVVNNVSKGAGMFPNWRQHIPTDIADEEMNLPAATSLAHNYPNPFNARTTIKYTLAADDHVVVEVFDLLGKKVITLQDGHQVAGEHDIVWNAESVASGTYFYRIQTSDKVETHAMTLLK